MRDEVDTSLSRAAGTTSASLPFWLTGILFCALMTVAGLIVYENYHNALREGETRAVSSAHVVAAHLEWMMEASDLALRRVETALDNRPIDSSPELIRDMSRAVGELPAGFEYSLLDQNGQMRFSSKPAAALPNHTNRAYFERLRDAGDEITFSRLLDEERAGNPSFIIARRIDRDGAFGGAASITIPNDNLDRFWASMNLGIHSTISIVRDDGWLMARRPSTARPVNLSTAGWYPMTRDQTSGVYHSSVSQIDGYARIVAFWKVQGWPLIALAAIERQEVLDQFWRNLFSDALLMVPLMAVLVIAAFWINRLLYRTATRNGQLEQALDRNRFLLREIHHRVKNNFQSVMALVRLQQMPAEARDDMSRRIAAMIAVHEQIYERDQFDEVEVAPYAEKLVRDIASSYDMPVAIELDLAPVTVDREQALPLGMIINEVVSNAFKYAFSKDRQGRLSIRLSARDDQLLLTISDDGPGIESFTRPGGMGSRLIANFIRQMEGELKVSNEGGAVFALSAPLKRSEAEAV